MSVFALGTQPHHAEMLLMSCTFCYLHRRVRARKWRARKARKQVTKALWLLRVCTQRGSHYCICLHEASSYSAGHVLVNREVCIFIYVFIFICRFYISIHPSIYLSIYRHYHLVLQAQAADKDMCFKLADIDTYHSAPT